MFLWLIVPFEFIIFSLLSLHHRPRSHLNKTTTFERPQRYGYDELPPKPRTVVLYRNPSMGFGFVAGSEKPVIVRFVTEFGPSVGKVKNFKFKSFAWHET